jgi:hypothetical protein
VDEEVHIEDEGEGTTADAAVMKGEQEQEQEIETRAHPSATAHHQKVHETPAYLQPTVQANLQRVLGPLPSTTQSRRKTKAHPTSR